MLVSEDRAEELRRRPRAVIAAADPLAALQSLARAWRHELGARVAGVTGSTGKTSTKDILAGMLGPPGHPPKPREPQHRAWAAAVGAGGPAGTEALVLEMAMRGEGQIAELTAIAEPDVGVIVNVGPVHLELLGTVERVAAAKAELVRDLRPGAACVVPPRSRCSRPTCARTSTPGPSGPGARNLVTFE